MKGGDILSIVGIWLLADALISIWYFWEGSSNPAQFFRLIRGGIAIYLIYIGGCYNWQIGD